MDEPLRARVGTPSLHRLRWPAAAMGRLYGFAVYLASLLLLLVGAVVAFAFAATLTFVMVLASMLLGLASLAWRLKAQPALRRAVAEPTRSGHAWVAYDWNRRSR